MPVFLIDEDLPHAIAEVLKQAGFEAEDVKHLGMAGDGDLDLADYARAHRRVIVTADMGFASTVTYPLGSHAGIIVLRIPQELPTRIKIRRLLDVLREIDVSDLTGALVIVEMHRVRLRRPPSQFGAPPS